MNSVQLVGRLGSAPEFKTTASGKEVCKLRIATDSGYGEHKRTDWHSVVAFGGLARSCAQLEKGRLVGVRGSIKYVTWQKEDGSNAYFTEILADDVEFLGPRPGGSGGQSAEARASTNGSGKAPAADYGDDMPF